jgi:hypothetical protein
MATTKSEKKALGTFNLTFVGLEVPWAIFFFWGVDMWAQNMNFVDKSFRQHKLK